MSEDLDTEGYYSLEAGHENGGVAGSGLGLDRSLLPPVSGDTKQEYLKGQCHEIGSYRSVLSETLLVRFSLNQEKWYRNLFGRIRTSGIEPRSWF
jgi:hypothetical protein